MTITLNPSDKAANVVLSGGNLTANLSSFGIGIVRATHGVSAGKWYLEFRPNSASPFNFRAGIATLAAALTGHLGEDAYGWAIDYNGQIHHNGSNTVYGPSYNSTHVLRILLDMDNGTLAFGRDSTDSFGTAFTGITGTVYPAHGLQAQNNDAGTWNFGDTAFAYSIPTGYQAYKDSLAPPSRTATLAATLEDVAGILQGTFTKPNFAATLAATLEDAIGALAGTTTRPVFTATLAALLDDAVGDMAGASYPPRVSTLEATLDDATGELAGVFDINVWRGISAAPGLRWASVRETGADGARMESGLGWTAPASLRPAPRLSWRQGYSALVELKAPWQPGRPQPRTWAGRWQGGDFQMRTLRDGWLGPIHHAEGWTLAYGTSVPRPRELFFPVRIPQRKRRAWSLWWGDAPGVFRETMFGAVQGRPTAGEISIVWHEGFGTEWVFSGPYIPAPVYPPHYQYSPTAELVFACRMPAWNPHQLDLIFSRGGCPWYTPLPVNVGGSILVQNSIEVVRLPDLKPIEVISVRLSLERDSWSWGLSLGLKSTDAMADISPIAGDPVEVQVTLNGVVWVCQIENFSENRLFGQRSYSATGRSTAATLAAPLAPAYTSTVNEDRLAAQICDLHLENTGWSMAYHDSLGQLMGLDWLIPGGTFTYASKTPLEAIGLIASAIGARLYADRRYQTLHLDPLYPSLPWEWDAVTPDAIIPFSLARSLGPHLTTKPAYNQVFVSGTTAAGQLVSVKRAGSAGDLPAPMVTDPLITAPLAGLARARSILGDTGKQARVPVELPLVLDPGLLVPGLLVQVNDPAGQWRGLVNSCAIDASFPTIKQTVEIERHY